jgi:hypothetical protein
MPALIATRPLLSRLRPWLILALAVVPAVWHVVDFEQDADGEYPTVERPTFNRYPPAVYRLAEPGDTIDRMAIYLSAGGVVLTAAGWWLGRGQGGLWPAALALALAALWHAATPGPGFDGWHGLGWRALFDPHAPPGLRLALAGAAIGLVALGVGSEGFARGRFREVREQGRARGINGLLFAAAVLVALRQVELPGVEPVGYWPRWAFFWGLLAFDLALVRAMPSVGTSHRALRRLGLATAGAAAWLAMVVGGIWLTWLHRPLERLRPVVPGGIYISAMPTALGLRIEQDRIHFRTILNLFPEDTAQRSDRLPDERRFVQEHGIRYVEGAVNDASAGSFLDRTLDLARDPANWPVLVHCHGSMDRSPAWMGIYRFVVQGRPLDEIMREIERHRGYRPKASVTLLYNRVLPSRAPDRYAADPTAALLRRCAGGVPTLPDRPPTAGANPPAPSRVSGGARGPWAERPNLTPSRRSLEYRKSLHASRLPGSAPPT